MNSNSLDRWRCLAILSLILLVSMLLMPGNVLANVLDSLKGLLRLESGMPEPGILPADKLVHIVLFALSTCLSCRAWSGKTARWTIVAGMSALAVITELGQIIIPGRSGELGDVTADLIGVLVGVLLCRFWLGERRSSLTRQ
jgi:VanZ family protein